MPCITAARLRAQAAHPGPALLSGLLEGESPAEGLAPHPTAWSVDLDGARADEDGTIAFPALLTVGWGPDHTLPWEVPVLLAETRHPCRLVVSGGGGTRIQIVR